MKSKLFAIFGTLLLSGIAAYGHHSFAGTYEIDKMQTIEGKVVQFQFRNPHSFFFIEAKDEKGQVIRWAIEGGGATQMREQGDKDPIKVGDILRITGNPARSAEAHRLRLLNMVRPSDGWTWGNRAGQVVD